MTSIERDCPAATARLQILMADDDPIFAALASTSLSRAGFAVHVARDGLEALELLERSGFDLALIDLSMPRVDGFRLIAMIRSTPRLRRLPIVVLSSRADAASVEEAYALGADAFQSKPVNWTLLPVHLRHIQKCASRPDVRDVQTSRPAPYLGRA